MEGRIINALADGSAKDAVIISIELQMKSSDFIDLNKVREACDSLFARGRLKRLGGVDFFTKYSLTSKPTETANPS